MIVFIPWNEEEGKPASMVRECPACGGWVRGHGWRYRLAHDSVHTRIRVRRGRCKQCRRTVTMLPWFAIPGAHYSLPARQQAEQEALSGKPAEQCAVETADPGRVVDPATVRRWFRRRWESLLGTIRWDWAPSTLFAWDWKAASRILIPEVNTG